MKRTFVIGIVVCSIMLLPVFAHDLFLKPASFFVKVNEKVAISVMNGTYQTSEGAVSFARLTDVSVVAPSGTRTNPKVR